MRRPHWRRMAVVLVIDTAGAAGCAMIARLSHAAAFAVGVLFLVLLTISTVGWVWGDE